jgi:phosphatidylethanolamine/phosphatidyl-N-methylethanolamine N-methyltransferase
MSGKDVLNFIPKSYVEFLKAALKNPLQISTVFQTSPWLSQRMLTYVDFNSASHIIELGAGAGAITERIVNKLNPTCQFTAFELNYTLVEFLKNSYQGERIEFVVGSAELARDYAAKKGLADAVVSSLPWTIFSEDLQSRILDSIVDSLKPGGVFLTYTCINATIYPNSKIFNRLINEKFKTCEKSATEWKNIPPAYVNVCRK